MCPTARAAWLTRTPRRCGTSMPWAGLLARRRWRLPPGPEAWQVLRAVHEGPGQLGQAAIVGPGVAPQGVERPVHAHSRALGQLALGLLDGDPAVQRGLQLLVERLAAAQAALVQQADRGHVGHGLSDPGLGLAERPRGRAEKVQRPDDLRAQP